MTWMQRSGARRRMGLVLFVPLILMSACSQSADNTDRAVAAELGARIGATLWTPWVWVAGFGASEAVTMSFDEENDGTIEWTQTATTSSSGDAPFNLGSYSVKVGSRITATSASYSRELIVEEVRIEYVNAATNVVSGYAPPSSQVEVEIMQAGPPLALVVVAADAEGRWSYDFTSLHDIEDGREVDAEVFDAQGNASRVWWQAVVPSVGAGYSQYGANSVFVRNFAPGTSVRLRIDYGSDGGPLDGFDYDQTSVVNNRYGFGFDLGGFDLLHPGDRLVATGGGWEKELTTVVLRIEKADPATDVVGGIAEPGATVLAGVMPPGGGGPAAAQQAVVAGPGTGVWTADFSALVDFDENRQVTASVFDEDGDETFTNWVAVTPYYSALVTDGPPSGVFVSGFAKGTSVRVRVDVANNGTYDYDLTAVMTQQFGYRFALGGSGLLNAGDRVVVDGGGWLKDGILASLSVALVDSRNDEVAGTAAPGAVVGLAVSPAPGEPGGPPVATATVTADGLGIWDVDLSGTVDLVAGQQVNATISDEDGDRTEAIGFGSQDVWPKTGFEKPVVNPPGYATRKAGSVVPIKFTLGGDRGMDVFEAGSPTSIGIECGTNPEMQGGEPIARSMRNGLTYNATTQIYELRWITPKNWKGTCRQLVVAFADGTTLRANFRFT